MEMIKESSTKQKVYTAIHTSRDGAESRVQMLEKTYDSPYDNIHRWLVENRFGSQWECDAKQLRDIKLETWDSFRKGGQ